MKHNVPHDPSRTSSPRPTRDSHHRQPLMRLLMACALLVTCLCALPRLARAEASWERLSGPNAYGTMQAVARAAGAFPAESGGTVVVATGEGYWDALAASGLAGRLGAPIIITPTAHLGDEARAEIERIRPTRVYVTGGDSAVSDAVLDQLRGLVADVQRISGSRAPETAISIYRTGTGWSKTAIVATCNGYWDALSIAPYAYAKAAPIFLTQLSGDPAGRVLSPETLDALRSGGFSEVVIVGGDESVALSVEDQIRSIGATPQRLSGPNAIDTSAATARWELARGMRAEGMGVASGQGYWDALTGAALTGKLGSVLVLTNPQNYRAIDAVRADHETEISHGYVFGGTSSVPQATYDYLCGRRSTTGPLHVQGAKLVDAAGSTVQLRGISTHGLAWFGQYVNADCFSELARVWNANCVRLALYTEDYGGYCSGGDREQLMGLVKGGIRYATDAGMYVIVDWHILSDGNPLTHKEDAKAFFRAIASEYGAQGNVIYEICNEPNGGTSWADIKSYAMEVIPVIREADPDSVIVVGTPTWSQEVDKPLADPLPFDNVMYTLHFYAATHRDDLRNRMVSCAQQGLPIFVTEFGICDASGNGAIDEASANQWVAAMNSLDISYCMWSLANKAESASAIASSCQKVSGFGQGDLAQAGHWLYQTLTSDKTYANLPVTSPDAGGGSGGGSSAKSVSQGSFEVTATLVNSWPNGGRTSYQYEVSLRNNGDAVSSWQVQLPFNKAVSYDGNGWNADITVSGSQMTLTSKDYNGSVAAGGTVKGIGFIVTADAGLGVV